MTAPCSETPGVSSPARNLAGAGFGPRPFIQRAQDPQQGEHVLWIISAHVGPFHFFSDKSDSSLNPAFDLSRALVSSPRAADPVVSQAQPPSSLPMVNRTMETRTDASYAEGQKVHERS